MPIYDCGVPDCEECQKAFGPDRSQAIANYESRARAYSKPKVLTEGEVYADHHDYIAKRNAILTEFIHPPIPDRSHDWSAVRDGYEPGAPIGRGETKGEAVADLLDQEDE